MAECAAVKFWKAYLAVSAICMVVLPKAESDFGEFSVETAMAEMFRRGIKFMGGNVVM